MKQQILFALPLLGAVVAHPTIQRRAVPREHAHEDILRKVDVLLGLNNPDNIQAAVFGLLGAAAAADGAGNIADPDCLQQATADQAFTNAKEAGDIDGMTDALLFRALERNTGSVGLESVPCESIQAVNPEIAAIQQHQDAAADGAQELNKEIAAELARQIALIGGDPLRANEASTFAPGEIGDPTANGGGCDDADDANGCINTLGLRVDDLSEDEIFAAIADVAGGAGGNIAAGNNTAVAAPGCNANVGKNAGNNAADNNKGANNNVNDNANNDAAADARQNDASASLLGASCNAAIVFGATSDGRKEDAFEPADLSTFNHGSALNIKVISGFICSQLKSACGDVGAAAQTACEDAAAAADGLTGLDAADAFNAVLGF